MQFIAKLILTALAFVFLLPRIPGITFHGGFMMALVFAFIFGVILWVVDIGAVAISAMLTITSLGVALLWLIPLWLLGFWLLPAFALEIVADLFPNYLSVAGWTPAALGGIVLLLIGIVTSSLTPLMSRKRV